MKSQSRFLISHLSTFRRSVLAAVGLASVGTAAYFLQTKNKREQQTIVEYNDVKNNNVYRFYSTVSAADADFEGEISEKKKKDFQSFLSENKLQWRTKLPTREMVIDNLVESDEEYDVIIVGGGATGAGIAVDAISRGLKTLLIEKFDFSSGTSSRSTKLIHGGVRYLEKAFKQFDIEQYRMVKEALIERANLLEIAPHLSYPLPIMLPIYKWYLAPYFYAGIKVYDLISGRKLLKSSYFIGKKKALELFPHLKRDELFGAIIYYDGAHNDARMNLSLIMTASRLGADCINHVTVNGLEEADGRINGVVCIDRLSERIFHVKGKAIVNATGAYTDSIRQMDDKSVKSICQPSAGVHIVLPDYYSPTNMGLLDPQTSDGRVIFFLPWQKHTLAGTTDTPCDLTDRPSPTEDDVEFILKEIKNYLNKDIIVRLGDVCSAWSGIRPLVSDPNKSDDQTENLARNHIIHVSKKGLITIAGGKWTTYREMAKETVDKLIETIPNISPTGPSQTLGLPLEGAHQWKPTSFIKLVQNYGLDTDVAVHLSETYGDKAARVCDLGTATKRRWPVTGKRLHEDFPYIEAEIRYGCRHENARRAVDMLSRRTRLSFLNVMAANETIDRIVQIMSEELNWTRARQKEEIEHAKHFLMVEMGGNLKCCELKNEKKSVHLTEGERRKYEAMFLDLDKERKGYLTIKSLKKIFTVNEIDIHDLDLFLNEVDKQNNGEINKSEFLQLMESLKYGTASYTTRHVAKNFKAKLDVRRSGGGV
ncbi:hypothetical protein SNEBB_005434 [Seison nebaliae]|nr:hypothetical protein SNEBB_005434 [Seison nebaliae]